MVLVLDLGRPDRLIVAMTHYNFKSIFAWNMILYSGFFAIVGVYLWTLMERRLNGYSKAGRLRRLHLAPGADHRHRLDLRLPRRPPGLPVGAAGADVHRPVLRLGAGGLPDRAAAMYAWNGLQLDRTRLHARMKNLLGVFVAAALYFVAVYHLTNLYFAKQIAFERFILLVERRRLPGAVLGRLRRARQRRCRWCCCSTRAAWRTQARCCWPLRAGDPRRLRLLYVFIVGGQAFPLEIFPGYEVTSSFDDGQVDATCRAGPKLLLGLGGLAAAFLMTLIGVRVLRLPAAGRRDRRAPAAESRSAARRHASLPRLRRPQVLRQDDRQLGPGRGAAPSAASSVQPFKKGPDYIDPLWLGLAAGRPCRNLDFYLHGRRRDRAQLRAARRGADVCLVEGNKGLYDGLDLDGSNSNAALARLLGLPVMLVLDARGMTRGIAPLILGYQAFDRDIRIARRDPQPPRRHAPRSQAARGDRALHRRAGARRRAGGSAPRAGRAPPRPDARERGRRRAGSASRRSRELVARAGRPRPPAARWPHRAAPGDAAAPLPGAGRARAADAAHRHRPRPRLRLLLRRRPGRACRPPAPSWCPSTRCATRSLPALDGLFIGGGFPECFMGELEANAALRDAMRGAIDGRPAGLRRMRRPDVPGAQHHLAAAARARWSARSPATW